MQKTLDSQAMLIYMDKVQKVSGQQGWRSPCERAGGWGVPRICGSLACPDLVLTKPLTLVLASPLAVPFMSLVLHLTRGFVLAWALPP